MVAVVVVVVVRYESESESEIMGQELKDRKSGL